MKEAFRLLYRKGILQKNARGLQHHRQPTTTDRTTACIGLLRRSTIGFFVNPKGEIRHVKFTIGTWQELQNGRTQGRWFPVTYFRPNWLEINSENSTDKHLSNDGWKKESREGEMYPDLGKVDKEVEFALHSVYIIIALVTYDNVCIRLAKQTLRWENVRFLRQSFFHFPGFHRDTSTANLHDKDKKKPTRRRKGEGGQVSAHE